MDKRFWIIMSVLVLALVGIFYVSSNKKDSASGSSSKGVVTNHVMNSSPAGVTLVEYGDYQCPACGQYYAPVKQVTEQYATRVKFQFRNFPLYQIHLNAIASARAAEAADLQGKYWEMHDALYETQQSWSNSTNPVSYFSQIAGTLKLDTAKFANDYKSAAVNDRIQADLREGNRLGVNSTPTFFLDGKKLSLPDPTVAAFSKILDTELAKKAAGGTPAPSPATVPEPAATPSPAE